MKIMNNEHSFQIHGFFVSRNVDFCRRVYFNDFHIQYVFSGFIERNYRMKSPNFKANGTFSSFSVEE